MYVFGFEYSQSRRPWCCGEKYEKFIQRFKGQQCGSRCLAPSVKKHFSCELRLRYTVKSYGSAVCTTVEVRRYFMQFSSHVYH